MAQPLAKITSMLGSARDLTIEAAIAASARFAETAPTSMGYQEVSKLLNSRNERDVLSGMKCVISQISRAECDQHDAVRYFGDVVKNITSNNAQVKNLIFIYVTKYAELEPDTALLSINTIQKALSDKNPTIRASAIRAILGIRILSISPIVLLCIKRTVGDNHPDVRSATAIAIGKIFETEASSKSTKKQLLEFLTKLLSDNNAIVVSSALKTFYKVRGSISSGPGLGSGSKQWIIIHGLYRKFCKILPNLDEWSQSFVIDILVDYCRLFIPSPKLHHKGKVSNFEDNTINDELVEVSMDPDLDLFINSLRPLLFSQSEFVILSVSRALLSLTPPKVYQEMNLALVLIRLSVSSKKIHTHFFILQMIRSISLKQSTVFSSKYKKFYVLPNDAPKVAKLKLEILSILANEKNFKQIFEELKFYVFNSNSNLISKLSLSCIGRCSAVSDEWNNKILKWCLNQIKKTDGCILTELLTIIRHLLQKKQYQKQQEQEKENLLKTIYKLSLLVIDSENGKLLESEAKASIIWIIGEFTTASSNLIGPDVLRNLISNFYKQTELVRYQILILSSKILTYELHKLKNESDSNEVDLFFEENIHSKMFNHVLQLSKYDRSYDTRDRARMFSVLLSKEQHETQLAALFLEVPKTVPQVKLGDINTDNSSTSFLDIFETYSIIPEWADPSTHPSSLVRNDITAISKNGGNATNGNAVKAISSDSYRGNLGSIGSISSSLYRGKQSALGPESNPGSFPKDAYKLQSLDEFFGDSDEEENEEEEEEEEQEEEDGDDEEEDDDDDDEDDLEESSELSSYESSSSDDDSEFEVEVENPELKKLN